MLWSLIIVWMRQHHFDFAVQIPFPHLCWEDIVSRFPFWYTAFIEMTSCYKSYACIFFQQTISIMWLICLVRLWCTRNLALHGWSILSELRWAFDRDINSTLALIMPTHYLAGLGVKYVYVFIYAIWGICICIWSIEYLYLYMIGIFGAFEKYISNITFRFQFSFASIIHGI